MHHRVDRAGRSEKLALQRTAVALEIHRLREISLGHGADDARRVDRGANEVRDQVVDRAHRRRPGALHVAQVRPLADAALLADELRESRELVAHALVQLHDVVEGIRDPSVHPGQARFQPHREVTLLQPREHGQQLPVIQLLGRRARPFSGGADPGTTLRRRYRGLAHGISFRAGPGARLCPRPPPKAPASFTMLDAVECTIAGPWRMQNTCPGRSPKGSGSVSTPTARCGSGR